MQCRRRAKAGVSVEVGSRSVHRCRSTQAIEEVRAERRCERWHGSMSRSRSCTCANRMPLGRSLSHFLTVCLSVFLVFFALLDLVA